MPAPTTLAHVTYNTLKFSHPTIHTKHCWIVQSEGALLNSIHRAIAPSIPPLLRACRLVSERKRTMFGLLSWGKQRWKLRVSRLGNSGNKSWMMKMAVWTSLIGVWVQMNPRLPVLVTRRLGHKRDNSYWAPCRLLYFCRTVVFNLYIPTSRKSLFESSRNMFDPDIKCLL